MAEASEQLPPATALDGIKGNSLDYARADHTHAVRVQRTTVVTQSDGTQTWTFSRPIVCTKGSVPPIAYMVEDAGSPVIVQITSRTFTTDNAANTDTHTAVTIKAQRSQLLPSILLSLAGLVSFNVFGANASGIKVNMYAGDTTQ